jgi:alkylation response protein AidB-like acyl-CoA dehydrogenase
VDFSLTADQQLLQDTGRKLLERECPPAVVRAHIDDPSVYEPLWRHLSEYVGLGVGDAADQCLFLEETGFAAAPGPFLATTLYTALTGDDENTGTVALVDDPIAPYVLEADRVDRIAIVTPDARLAVVDAADVPARFVATVDFSRRLFALDLPQVEAQPLAAGDYDRWRDRAYACMAAEMVGTARRIFDMALAYAKERKQFDVSIGSFQAIQHKLADMSLALERATAAVHYAAMTIEGDDPLRVRECHVA